MRNKLNKHTDGFSNALNSTIVLLISIILFTGMGAANVDSLGDPGAQTYEFGDDSTIDMNVVSSNAPDSEGDAVRIFSDEPTKDYATSAVEVEDISLTPDSVIQANITYDYYEAEDNGRAAPDEVYLQVEDDDGKHILWLTLNDEDAGQTWSTRNVSSAILGGEGRAWSGYDVADDSRMTELEGNLAEADSFSDNPVITAVGIGKGSLSEARSHDVYYKDFEVEGQDGDEELPALERYSVSEGTEQGADGEVTVAEANYASIQSAVDNAESGARVTVKPGEYEGFNLNKAVDVLGPNSETVGTDHDEESATIEGTVNIKDLNSETDVAFKGFTVESNEERSAVDINGLEDYEGSVSVANNVIDGEGSANGVGVNTAGSVDVEGNMIQNVKNGVHLRPVATDVEVEDNSIEGAEDSTPNNQWVEGAAIKVVDQSEGVNVQADDFTGNTFRNNDLAFWLEAVDDGSDVKKTEPGSEFVSTLLGNNDFGKAVTVRDDQTEETGGSEHLAAVFTDIQDAVDMADEGSRVNVRDGEYVSTDLGEPAVLVDKKVSLVGSNQPTISYEPVEISGEPAVKVTADGASVDGFDIDRIGQSRSSDTKDHITQGIRVSGSDVVIRDNDVDGSSLSGLASKGIMVLDDESDDTSGEDVSSVTVANNEVSGFYVGLSATNGYGGSLSDVNFSYNTVEDNRGHGANVATKGSDYEDHSPEVVVEENTFSDNNGKTLRVYGANEDAGLEAADASEVDFNQNSVPQGSVLENNGAGTLNAEQNYFGSASGPSDGQIQGDVDYRPWRMNPIDEEGFDEVITFDDADSWSAFSVSGEVVDAEIASDNAQVLGYNTSTEDNSDGWTHPSIEGMTPVDAAFVKGTKAVGVNYAEDPGTVSRSLGEGWNFIGAYRNIDSEWSDLIEQEGIAIHSPDTIQRFTLGPNEDSEFSHPQSVRNVFSPVESSIVSFQAPGEHNGDKAGLERYFDYGPYSGTILSTSNWDSSEAFDLMASVYDGYWVKASESATLSTTPEPVEEG